MNIFILSENPHDAAIQQCDKHIVKMPLESAQMLCTAHRMLDGTETRRPSKSGKTMVKYWELPDDRESILYKAVHFTHPCTLWTMESEANYYWHYRHFLALSVEYQYRYGREHESWKLLRDILATPPENIQRKQLTPFRLAMGAAPQCIDPSDPVGSYRAFYHTKQDNFKMTWSKRPVPQWFQAA